MPDRVTAEGLVVEYGGSRRLGFSRRPSHRAVDGVSFAIPVGSTFGLVGESGSGKSSIARALLLLAPISAGQIEIDGVDVRALARRDIREFRRSIQIVFQQPGASLNPKMRIGASIAEPLIHLRKLRGKAVNDQVEELLATVGLDPSMATRFPRQLSEGQRQRVAIARSIAPRPSILLADEPTSSLDVSVQAQILNLLQDLQTKLNLTMLFISHNLATVRQVADEIGVMYQGHLVETGPPEVILHAPKSQYARDLLAAVPTLPDREEATP